MSQENESENLLPNWLTLEYLERILCKNSKQVKVTSFTVKRAVPPGNNFISVLLRVTVTYTEGTKDSKRNLIIKLVDSDPVNAKRMEEHGFYKREIIMFGRILPKITQLLEQVGDFEKIVPELLAVDYTTQTLVFEDLTEKHFQTGNCKTGIDQSHIDIIIRKIAKFHACSLLLKSQESETFEEFNKGLIAEDRSGPTKFFELTLTDLIEEIGSWEGYDLYKNKFQKLKEIFVEQGVEVYKQEDGEFCVLNHGDLWTNNLMFQYDETGRVMDGVLLDFQLCLYGTPVMDLIYLRGTSASDDIKTSDFGLILEKYYGHIVENLKKLRYTGKIPTLFQLYSKYVEKMFYGKVATTFYYLQEFINLQLIFFIRIYYNSLDISFYVKYVGQRNGNGKLICRY